jgi:peptidoglycan/LPS O-acetylase OafA/YrhL
VSLFFVLSGFILTYVYPSLDAPGALRRFLVARAARIWPAHIVTLLLAVWLMKAHSPALPTIANVTMLHGWIPLPEYFFSYNAVSWTISTEFGFYILFPLLIWRFDRTWHWKLALVAGLTVFLIWLTFRLQLPSFSNRPGLTNMGVLYINPGGRLLEFMTAW